MQIILLQSGAYECYEWGLEAAEYYGDGGHLPTFFFPLKFHHMVTNCDDET